MSNAQEGDQGQPRTRRMHLSLLSIHMLSCCPGCTASNGVWGSELWVACGNRDLSFGRRAGIYWEGIDRMVNDGGGEQEEKC